MEFILEQAKLIYPGHVLDGKRFNIKIRDGVIISMDAKINSKQQIITGIHRLVRYRNIHGGTGL
jgi:hypothetical protein